MSTSTRLSVAMDVDGNAQREFDVKSQETITRFSAVLFDEDFFGPGHTTVPTQGSPAAGYPWVQRIVHTGGTVTVAPVSNAAGGVVALTLASTSEAEEADLYWNDMLNWDMTKYASFESRLAMATLPAASAECVWGFRSAWVSGPDSFTQYLDFQINGSGAVNVRIKDGVSSAQSAAATPAAGSTNLPSGLVAGQQVTLSAGVFHNFRIDISDPTNVLFVIDGVRVSSATTKMTFAATGSNAILQPYFSCYKASGTDAPVMQVDSCQLSMNRA